MMFGGVDKGEYEAVVKANNEMRAKMEKLRLENAVLKDQVRALTTLPQELISLYTFIQPKMNVTMADLKREAVFEDMDEATLQKRLDALVATGLVERIEKDWMIHYSLRIPDLSDSWVPKDKAAMLAKKDNPKAVIQKIAKLQPKQ